MNINAVNDYSQVGNIGINNKTKQDAADSVVSAFEKAVIGNGKPMNSVDVSNNRIGSLSDSITSVEEALKNDAQVAKDNLKALFNKLSGAEAVVMDEDGWDINDLDDEEILTVVDRIKIMLAAYCEDYQVMSGDIDTDAIKEAVGDNALASKISKKLSGTYIPSTEENAEEVSQALEMAEELDSRMNDETLSYLMKNNLEPTISNVYMAQHSASGMNVQAPVDDSQWQQLIPQVDRLIEKAGLEVSDETREEARWLIERQINLTTENILKLDELSDYEFLFDEDTVIESCVDAMADGKKANEAFITGKRDSSWKMVSEAISVLNNAAYEDVENVTRQYGSLTIARLSLSMTSVEGYIAANYSVEVSSAVVTNNRILNEARLMLTAYSGSVLVNSGIDIFNEDLSNIVDMLHEEQNRYIINEFSDKQAGSVSEEDLNRVSGFTDIINSLKFMPSAAIGAVITAGVTVTVASMHHEGSSFQQRYEQAGQAYDTMSTKVRSDMGDNIKKAVDASASAILEDLGLEQTKENVRCINILAANSMEITEENIYTVKNIDTIINNIMDNISPETVLEMIRDGINPLDAPVEALNDFINEKQEDVTDEIEKFSEFLYKLDKNGDISSDEREKFIGVYKMFSMFKKDSGRAIGALVNQGADITMGNLVMAINSRRNYSMDVVLDENAGMAEVTGKAAYFDTLFSTLGNSINPKALKDKAEDIDGMSLERFAELMGEADSDREVLAEYYNEQIEAMKSFAEAEDRVIRMLTDYDVPVTFNNLMASEGINKNIRGMFGRYFGDESEEKVKSDLEKLTEALESEEDANEAYLTLQKDVNMSVRRILSGEESDRLDLRELRTLTEGVRLMGTLSSRHNYIIPFETDEGIAAINLKLVSDGSGQGKITIGMTIGDSQRSYIECNVSRKKIDIFALAGNSALDGDVLGKGLDGLGFEDINIISAVSSTIPSGSTGKSEAVPTPLLYRAAKTLVKNLMAAETN